MIASIIVVIDHTGKCPWKPECQRLAGRQPGRMLDTSKVL
jgi:hypothetical protein